MSPEKRIVNCETLQSLRSQWRCDNLRLVMTNGIFDLFHSGHARYLEQARVLGDILVVGINSDHSTRLLKGSTRPLIPQQERAYLLASLRWVDYVTIFDEQTAENLVALLMPETYVKGGDYAASPPAPTNNSNKTNTINQFMLPIDEHRLPEARVVRTYGGQTVLLPYEDGLSTTTLIERMMAVYNR
jgi:rfaE bifunctional protein nucleotidyltransferase chain/domain